MYVETYGKQAGRQVGGQARGSVGRFRLEMSVCNECTGDEFGRSESGSRLWVWVVSGPPDARKRIFYNFAAEVHIQPQRLQGEPTGRLRLEAVLEEPPTADQNQSQHSVSCCAH